MRLLRLLKLPKSSGLPVQLEQAPLSHCDFVDSIVCGLCGDIIPIGFSIADEAINVFNWDELLCRTCLDRAVCIEDVIDDLERARHDDGLEC